MRNQFFYTRKVQIGVPETPEFEDLKDSFNVEKVIRSITLPDKRTLVLLDDIHERVEETPNINTKTNKVIGTIRKRDTFQTEVYLTPEDAERFERLTSIDYLS